jgi:hypothetical protein
VIEPFHLTKRIAGIGKQNLMNYNWGYAYVYASGIVVLGEVLDMIRLWPIAVGWRIIPSRNLSFTKNNFG